MGSYNAFISLSLEHGVYAKDEVLKNLDANFGDYIWITTELGIRRGTIEQVRGMSEVDSRSEALMMLSLFDCLAENHYYFLAEFGFTERIAWVPKQFNYVIDTDQAFESLKEERKEHKAFKTLYSIIEDNFLDVTMALRSDYGVDLGVILEEGSDEEKSVFKEMIDRSVNLIEPMIAEALRKADLVIGAGTFFSTMILPLETAFLVSGVDVGAFTLPDFKHGITVNPFLLYWVLTRMFRLNGKELEPSYIPVKLERIEGLRDREAPIRKLKFRTFSPSKLCVETFYPSEEDAVQHCRGILLEKLKIKPYVLPGDVIAPFTCPSIVHTLELAGYEQNLPYKAPFIDSTPYGRIIYGKGMIIPRISSGSEVDIEFFTNPIYDISRPLILDTNVITMLSFPYKVESPFFDAFMNGRKVIIPSIVVYELKRKLEVGKEREGVIRALSRLREMNAIGLIDLEVTGKLPPELILHELYLDVYGSRESKGEEGKEYIIDSRAARRVKSDLRDTLIILEAIEHKGVLFSNDLNLREIALMFGTPSISYNSLLDDVREIVREICRTERVHKNHLVKTVKERSLEIRGEEYTDEEIAMALSYLVASGEIKFEGDYIHYLRRLTAR
ncbi:MAG: hypothetical protein QXT14_08755 [Candidatus Bathyarchaeia archaeon]